MAKGKPLFGRPAGRRKLHTTFLILCEGKSTEPQYLSALGQKLRLPALTITGEGRGGLTLIKRAIKEKGKNRYDEIWCVFDRDHMKKEQFREALGLARQHGIHVVYSIWCFEIWLILHFDYCATTEDRKLYKARLSKYLGYEYDKACHKMAPVLVEKHETAIENAKRLAKSNKHVDPYEAIPSTTVHDLVLRLKKAVRS